MRAKTRRQEIEGNYRREQISVIAMILAALILLLSNCSACVRSCSSDSEEDPVRTEQEETVDTAPAGGAVDLTALWGSLSDDDVRFIMSLTEYPRLINADNPLRAGYVPDGLIRLTGVPDGDGYRLAGDAARAYYQLYLAMADDGLNMLPLSAYRTYDEQVSIYNYNVQLHTEAGMTPEQARERTEQTIAVPGESEHQYGRSIDVTLDRTTNHDFHKTEQGQWLIEHAHEYGFVIRYPDDKVSITGINYEPWHLRWVGTANADFMHRHNLCLEEYVEFIRSYNPGAVMIDG